MRLWELSIKPVHNPHPQYTLTLSVRCSYVTWGSACCLSLSLSCRHWVEQLLNFIEPILYVLGPAWLIRKRLNLKFLLAMLLNRIPGSRNGKFSVIFVMFTVLALKKFPKSSSNFPQNGIALNCQKPPSPELKIDHHHLLGSRVSF